MRYTLSITEQDYCQLVSIVRADADHEGAAYLLCGRSNPGDEMRLLVREVMPVVDDDYLVRDRDRLSIASQSYTRAAKRAAAIRASLVFVHSHPPGFDKYSTQDNVEEPKLMAFFAERLPDMPHGSVLVLADGRLRGRAWVDGNWNRMERLRVVGTRFRFFDDVEGQAEIPPFFDRQVRAFGPDIQRLLARLHIGIVGVGGTGSAVVEQLIRLGVGTISTFDGEDFDPSNVNRVYGSRLGDAGAPKVRLVERTVMDVGVGTKLIVHPSHITDETTAKALRPCDVVFGCTDKHTPRGTLVRLALWYLIPVIDIGVKIDAPDGTLRGVDGRVTALLPNEACLFCRQRISPKIIMLESLTPEEWAARADEDYAPELDTTAPAVIPYTTAVAAQAVSELLHRLTGFMGEERVSSETLILFHEPSIKTNRVKPVAGCLCTQRNNWGLGDRRSFLDLMWPTLT